MCESGSIKMASCCFLSADFKLLEITREEHYTEEDSRAFFADIVIARLTTVMSSGNSLHMHSAPPQEVGENLNTAPVNPVIPARAGA